VDVDEDEEVVVVIRKEDVSDNTHTHSSSNQAKIFLPVYIAVGNVDGRHGCSISDKVCITPPNIPFQIQTRCSDPLT
jgi:carbonic anhydrase/acetyltransferase-like protein (isoleucine patch superfamily)